MNITFYMLNKNNHLLSKYGGNIFHARGIFFWCGSGIHMDWDL